MTSIFNLKDKHLDYVIAFIHKEDLEHCIRDDNLYIDYFYSPSNNWDQGGSIIEKEKISVKYHPVTKVWTGENLKHSTIGPTPLVAAMRCYAATKLGYEVDMEKIYKALQIVKEWYNEKV